jgi:hypothetical protein
MNALARVSDRAPRSFSRCVPWTFVAISFAVVCRTHQSARAQPPAITSGVTVQLQPVVDVAGAFGPPTFATHADDGSGRLFLPTLNGFIRMLDGGTESTFLDIESTGVNVMGGGERGFLGLAFHPNFAATLGTPGRGKLYTLTSEPASGGADFSHPDPSETAADHYSVLREWNVSDSNPNVVDTSAGINSSRVLLRLVQPQSNHNGGAIDFGPDNNLYIAVGDGGGSNDNDGGVNNNSDGHTNGTGNAQDLRTVLGKILRIDPLGTNSANGRYGVPADNPFVGVNGVDEIFAYGLRNPFRMGFDRETGLLYAGDVGQGQREEVDLITSGGNYGWVYWEGTRANRGGGPAFPSTVAPVGEYTHGDGNSIIGGFVYRGDKLPMLEGKYVFGDLAGTTGVGRLFYLDLDTHLIKEFVLSSGPVPGRLFGIGEGDDGELYATFETGDVLRFSAPTGDLNLDGQVNIFDVNLISDHWGEAGPLGDANFDGVVDIFDVNVISDNWTGAVAAAVPEPQSIATTLIVLLGIAVRCALGRRTPLT